MKAIVLKDKTVCLRNDLTDEQVYQQYKENVIDIVEVGENIFYKPLYEDGEIVESLSINDAKELIKNKVRKLAASVLSQTDWKMIRHRDQVDASENTSLTNEEYQTLLLERQAVRNWSNNREGTIASLTSVHDVMTFTIGEPQ